MPGVMMRTLVLTLACLWPVGAWAQDARLTARLDAGTAARVTELVDSAQAERLPTEPLVQKALEGATMGASSERIARAVQTLLGNLRGARAALGPEAAEPDLVAGASSLRAGVTAAALRQLRATRPGQPLAIPLAVLTDLIARGMPQAEAETSVLALARDGGGDAEFLALRRRLEGDIESGATPAPGATPDPGGRPRGMPAPGAPTSP
jgi:hypothetical protein